MVELKAFLRGTRVSSRVLFVLWLIALCGATQGGDIFSIAYMTAVIMVPIVSNELCQNPIFEQEETVFFKFIRNTKVSSRILFQLWCICLVPQKSDVLLYFGAFVSGTLLLLLPAILIEKKNNPIVANDTDQLKTEIEEFGGKVNGIAADAGIIVTKYWKAVLAVIVAILIFIAVIKFILLVVDAFNNKLQETGSITMAITEITSQIIALCIMIWFGKKAVNWFKKVANWFEEGDKEPIVQDREEYDKIDDVFAVDGMDGLEFEYFCADILRKNGFYEVSVTRGSGDQGVDILAVKNGIKYAIQCKNYASPLGNTPVQEVNAGKSFYRCHVGAVLTNSTFTPGAKALAQATGILLWDRVVLQEMMDNAE